MYNLIQQRSMTYSAAKMLENGMTLKPPIGRFLKTYSEKVVRRHPALIFLGGHPDGC